MTGLRLTGDNHYCIPPSLVTKGLSVDTKLPMGDLLHC